MIVPRNSMKCYKIVRNDIYNLSTIARRFTDILITVDKLLRNINSIIPFECLIQILY